MTTGVLTNHGARDPGSGVRWGRLFLAVTGLAAAVVIVIATARAVMVCYVYSHVLRFVLENTGLDLRWARPVALMAVALLPVVPVWSLILPWRSRRRGRALFAGMFLAAVTAGLAYKSENVFFDSNGRPVEYFALVPGGFKLSDRPGFDRYFGVKFQPISPVVANRILAWQRAKGKVTMQPLPCDPSFDFHSGAPICWWDTDSEGHSQFSSVPGFDPSTGIALKPVSTQVISKFRVLSRNEALRQSVISSPAFRSTRVVLSNPPSIANDPDRDHVKHVDGITPGTEIAGEIIVPKHITILPPLDSPDGVVALEVQQESGCVPGERILFRVTNDFVVGGVVILPRLSMAEGRVAVWTFSGEAGTLRFGVTFTRVWMHPHTRPQRFSAHLVAEKGLLSSGALNVIVLDQAFPALQLLRPAASPTNGQD